MFRLFVAVDLPDDIRKQLGNMFFGIPGARWVPEEQLHLTVRFVGEVDGGIFRDIRDNLRTICLPPFSMQMKGLGCFPPRRQPKVLWVGIEKNEHLVRLRKRVEAVVVNTGVPPEQRKFSPHVTLARFREPSIGKLTNFLAGNGLYGSREFSVREFYLYSSYLTPKGAIHQIEAAYPLTEKPTF